jgi:intracellular septation protein A
MDWSIFLLGALPLLVFVIVDSFSTMRHAVIGALAAAALEIGYSLYAFGEIDEFSIVSVALIMLFGGLSLKLGDPIYFKFKPVVLALVLAGTFFVTYALGNPLLVMAVERYGKTLPESAQRMLSLPEVQIVFERASLFMGFGLIAHAGVVVWAALRLGNWWWLAARSVGFYAMMVLVVLISRAW